MLKGNLVRGQEVKLDALLTDDTCGKGCLQECSFCGAVCVLHSLVLLVSTRV